VSFIPTARAGSLGSVVAEELARNGVPTIDIVDPDVMEVVNLTRRTYLGDDIDQAKVGALHGICASAVRPTTRCW